MNLPTRNVPSAGILGRFKLVQTRVNPSVLTVDAKIPQLTKSVRNVATNAEWTSTSVQSQSAHTVLDPSGYALSAQRSGPLSQKKDVTGAIRNSGKKRRKRFLARATVVRKQSPFLIPKFVKVLYSNGDEI